MADVRDTNKDGVVDTTELAAAISKTSAYDEIVNMFNDVGAPELGKWLADFIKGDPTVIERKGEILTQLQESEPYKQRFSGLFTLREYNRKNPTNPVFIPSEAQYLATESQMREILKPVAGMYGTAVNTVIGNLIGGQISPAELQDRVNAANSWVQSTDPNIKTALRQYYGIDDTQLLQYALDPEKGTADIQRTAGAAVLGGQALSSYVDLTAQESESIIRNLTASGRVENQYVAGQEAAQALERMQSAGTISGISTLGRVEGADLTGAEILGAEIGVNAQAAEEIRGLKSRERARFSGEGAQTNVLAEQVSGNI